MTHIQDPNVGMALDESPAVSRQPTPDIPDQLPPRKRRRAEDEDDEDEQVRNLKVLDK